MPNFDFIATRSLDLFDPIEIQRWLDASWPNAAQIWKEIRETLPSYARLSRADVEMLWEKYLQQHATISSVERMLFGPWMITP